MQPIVLKSEPPVALKAAPPASSHQLQYSKYKQRQMQAEIDISKQNSLLGEIDRLCTALRTQESQFVHEKEKIFKNIVLMSLQIEHMREIHRQYDLQLKKSEETCEDMESIYALKLEALKKELMQQFAEQLSAEKEATFNELKELKEIYCCKLAQISKANRSQEAEVELKARAIHETVLKITLLETKLENKQRDVQKYAEIISNLEREKDEKCEENRRLASQLQSSGKDSATAINNMKLSMQESSRLNSELHEQLLDLKNILHEKQNECAKLEEQNSELTTELQSTLEKLRKMENEMAQLNRKTEKNKEHIINASFNANLRNEGLEMMEADRDSSMTEEHQQQIGRSNSSSCKLDTKNGLTAKLKELENVEQQYHRMKEMYNQLSIDLECEKAKREQAERYGAGESGIRIRQLELQIDQLTSESQKKNFELEQLREDLYRTSQQYGHKVALLNRNTACFKNLRREQERELQALQKSIEEQYLKEIQGLRQEKQSLQQTLESTNLMMETMAIQKKGGGPMLM